MIQPLTKRTIAEDIIDQLMNMIRSGELKPNTRLPSERELANQFGVSRTSIREAMKALAFTGIVAIRPGDGTYVNAVPSAAADDSLYSSMLLHHKSNFHQTAEARRVLEVQISKLATQRATEEAIDELGKSIERMERFLAQEDFDAYTKEDLNFHCILAKACQNDVLYCALDAIWRTATDVVLTAASVPGRNFDSFEQHKLMLTAMKNGDVHLMETTMEAHMDYAYENLVLYFNSLKKESK